MALGEVRGSQTLSLESDCRAQGGQEAGKALQGRSMCSDISVNVFPVLYPLRVGSPPGQALTRPCVSEPACGLLGPFIPVVSTK